MPTASSIPLIRWAMEVMAPTGIWIWKILKNTGFCMLLPYDHTVALNTCYALCPVAQVCLKQAERLHAKFRIYISCFDDIVERRSWISPPWKRQQKCLRCVAPNQGEQR